MICPKCSQPNADTAQFCALCGAQLTAAPPTGVPMPGSSVPPSPGYAPYSPPGQPAPPNAAPQPGYAPYGTPPGQMNAPAPYAGQSTPGYSPPGIALPGPQCRVCGAQVAANAYQCARCGAPVGTVANPNDMASATYLPVGGYAQMENTSGRRSTVPPELQGGWNWGASFLNIFWAIAHGVWWVVGVLVGQVALLVLLTVLAAVSMASSQNPTLLGVLFIYYLCLIPFNIGLFIYLGVKGNSLAWKYRMFQDVQHCRTVQSVWAKWVLGWFILSFSLGILGGILGSLTGTR